MHRILLPVLVVGWLAAGDVRAEGGPGDRDAFFELKIRPVLAGTCFRCHGGKKTSGGLRVDSRKALVEGGDGGPAIVPGDPESSLLVRALRHDHETLKMPPDRRLPDAALADFTAWVRDGAAWPEGGGRGKNAFAAAPHWAFEPVREVAPPADPSGWAEHPVDRFLAAGWRAKGLSPVGPAEKRELLRRATFDLAGLPPTPEEIARFLADDAPDAFDRVVDRLLASPRYGERWGRHWLDVARYADTAGDNADYPIPEARLYRDYVIGAFNADKPYDAFVREQLAGDILAAEGPRERYAERVAATGFLALSRRYATAPYELWHLTLEDTIDTTGRAFLGLTLRCARCHDHKFDPVTTEDYYALYGIFASTTFAYAGSEEFSSMARPRENFVPLVPLAESAPRVDAHRRHLAELEASIPRRAADEAQAAGLAAQAGVIAEAVRRLEAAGQDPKPLHDQLNRLARRREEHARGPKAAALGAELKSLRRAGLPPDLPAAYAVSEGTPVHAAIQRGGEPADPGKVARRGVPKALAGPAPSTFPENASGRRELAAWLTRPEHPLTARVMVNRIWQHHFGRGIVATPSNFGLRGAEPSHPELLDYLAARFVASGWSVKAMHRLILTSKAYALASTFDPGRAAIDPANVMLWRHDRRRLDAESIRDAMLAVSGSLDERPPGGHPFPPIGQWGWTQHNAFKATYPSAGRSVYLMTQRLVRHPYLALFDGPDPNTTTDVRTSATVPAQALFLMNNPFVKERAAALAGRLAGVASDPASRVEWAHELAWGRPARPDEVDRALAYLARYERAAAGADASREAWVSFARLMLTSNEFLYLD